MTIDERRRWFEAQLDRRQFLAGAGALGAAVAVGARRRRTLELASSTKPAGSDLGAVEHVVMLMQENRSFDHYFGTYPGVRGFDDHPAGHLGVFAQPDPANSTKPPVGVLVPFHLDTATGNAECTYDLTHSWVPQHQCWNGGAMDGFVTTHTSTQYEGPVNGVLTMGYYTRADLPFYYALADAFTLCDGYHCSVLGPTDPNRLFWMSGTNDPDGGAGGPVLVTASDNSVLWTTSWTTMPEVLSDHGVSWKVYNPPGVEYTTTSPLKLVWLNELLYFAQYQDPATELHQRAFLPQLADFATDVANDQLPQVSWLIPPILPQDLSEHPPSPPAAGEHLTHQVIETLASNPEVWAKTVLFVSYDENDGFFDHLRPPTPPAGTPGEYLTVDPLPAAAGGVAGPIGLGFRVPMLVVSPFSRGGRICSTTFDHTSQLRFLEARFGVRVPNLSDWRRRTTGDLTETLDMSSRVTSLPSLPVTSADPPVVAMECTASQRIEVNGGSPYLPPGTQRMPVQERRR